MLEPAALEVRPEFYPPAGALALASSLLYPETLGGAVVFSGWIPSQELQMTDGGKKTPVLWCHGDADNVVEYANARVGCPRLQAAGVACELKVRSSDLTC